MSETLQKAIRLLGTYTAGRFDVWMIAGKPKAACRAHVMAALLGKDKVPQAYAGVNALRDEFYRQASIEGNCEAERQDNFIKFCKEQVHV